MLLGIFELSIRTGNLTFEIRILNYLFFNTFLFESSFFNNAENDTIIQKRSKYTVNYAFIHF